MKKVLANNTKPISRINGSRAIGMVLVAVFLIFVIAYIVSGEIDSHEIRQNIQTLQAIENQDLEKVEARVQEAEKSRLSNRIEELRTQLLDGELDVWSMFGDFVILGDSRAVGFYYHEYLPRERVLAEGGHTIRDIETQKDVIRELRPSSIFLCYGLNDVSIGYWKTPEEYVTEYLQVIKDLQSEFSNSTIYVNSTLPAREPAFERAKVWREIPVFNVAVQAMCEENNIPFIDNSGIAEEYAELWDVDGIHVDKTFYPYWATNMILAMFEETAAEG